MPRLIAAIVGLAALMTAVPSAAQVGSGQIAYAREGEGVYTVAPDGSALVLLKSGLLRQARWSPDGSRIAYVGYSGRYGVHVMNADGSGDHVVATDATGVISLSKQPWSADGSRLAWGPFSEGDIYTASAAGGDVRRITTDGLQKEPPVWSPSGAQLACASIAPGPPVSWELFSVRDDGSAPVQITSGGFQNMQPSWLPSGSSIAFVRTVNSRRVIYVVRPDGTELHRVVEFSGSDAAGEPVWSPDGSKIAYTNQVNARSAPYSAPGVEIFLVNADGSGERRLTELAPQFAYDTAPTWSPDGDQILFKRRFGLNASLTTMNPDGTCESALKCRSSRHAEPPRVTFVASRPGRAHHRFEVVPCRGDRSDDSSRGEAIGGRRRGHGLERRDRAPDERAGHDLPVPERLQPGRGRGVRVRAPQ